MFGVSIDINNKYQLKLKGCGIGFLDFDTIKRLRDKPIDLRIYEIGVNNNISERIIESLLVYCRREGIKRFIGQFK